MYSTLISSLLNETFTGNEEESSENIQFSGEYFPDAGEDAYPYSQPESEAESPVTKVSPETSAFFNAKKNRSLIALNQANIQKSGLTKANIMAALEKHIDVDALKQSLLNQSGSDDPFLIDDTGMQADSVFVEALHQFQMTHYIHPGEQDGLLGQSTLETLGFFNHKLKSRLNSEGFYGQKILYSLNIGGLTGNEFTASNWFAFIIRPAFLGIKIHSGIHVLLYRKLKEAEAWLLAQPQYQGLTPAALGRAMGFRADSRYSGARLSADNQAMHSFGLALDINVPGNPWIGAGWVKSVERIRMKEALVTASGGQKLPGETIFAYLDSVGRTKGTDTAQAYSELKQRNDEFISYLRSNNSELDFWRKSLTFGGRDPLQGFLNLHTDLVYALRQIAGLAWGAIDFSAGASGDIMHFDLRTQGVGKVICEKIGGYVPKAGHHPLIQSEAEEADYELHESIGEGENNEAW